MTQRAASDWTEAAGMTGDPDDSMPSKADRRVVELEMTRTRAETAPQEMTLIQVFERLDRYHREILDTRERELAVRDQLYRDLLDGRDRELHAKERLIAELEQRAQRSESQAKALEEYIQNLPSVNAESTSSAARSRWKFWRR
ncbi:MAG: hypothetical protein ACR2JC_05590 [Chloroflexota bacterium]